MRRTLSRKGRRSNKAPSTGGIPRGDYRPPKIVIPYVPSAARGSAPSKHKPPGSSAASQGRLFSPPRSTPFDLTHHLTKLTEQVVAAVPEFRHIDPSRLSVSLALSRNGSAHGTYAQIVPLRYAGGARSVVHRGRTYTMPPLRMGGVEKLYLLYFMVPRFMDLPFRKKLQVIFHELYHVGENFDGDLRRFSGRRWAHGRSRQAYDRSIDELVTQYLANCARRGGIPYRAAFLHATWKDLIRIHGSISGHRIPHPRAVRANA